MFWGSTGGARDATKRKGTRPNASSQRKQARENRHLHSRKGGGYVCVHRRGEGRHTGDMDKNKIYKKPQRSNHVTLPSLPP